MLAELIKIRGSDTCLLDSTQERPHSSLDDLTPNEFMRLEEQKGVGVL